MEPGDPNVILNSGFYEPFLCKTVIAAHELQITLTSRQQGKERAVSSDICCYFLKRNFRVADFSRQVACSITADSR